jgi:hypothetical protein
LKNPSPRRLQRAARSEKESGKTLATRRMLIEVAAQMFAERG